MMLAARIGIGLQEWEAMTPRELFLWSAAYRERLRDEARAKQIETYNLAGLIRSMVWAKHAPSLESVFPNAVRKKDMTDEQMYEQVKALNRLFGGTEEA